MGSLKLRRKYQEATELRNETHFIYIYICNGRTCPIEVCKCRKEFCWEPLENTLHARHVYLHYCRFSLETCIAPHRFHISRSRSPNEVKNNNKSLFQIHNNHSSTYTQHTINQLKWGSHFNIEKREQMLFNEICWKTRVNLWNLHPNILVSFSFQTETALRGQKVIERDFTVTNSFGGQLLLLTAKPISPPS